MCGWNGAAGIFVAFCVSFCLCFECMGVVSVWGLRPFSWFISVWKWGVN